MDKELRVSKRWTGRFATYWPPIGIGACMLYCVNPMAFRMYEIYVQHHNSKDVQTILPLDGWFPWDEHEYYGYSYFLQTTGVLGCCMGSICYDQLYVSSLIIISCQLKFLGVALRTEINRYVKNKFYYKSNQQIFASYLSLVEKK